MSCTQKNSESSAKRQKRSICPALLSLERGHAATSSLLWGRPHYSMGHVAFLIPPRYMNPETAGGFAAFLIPLRFGGPEKAGVMLATLITPGIGCPKQHGFCSLGSDPETAKDCCRLFDFSPILGTPGYAALLTPPHFGNPRIYRDQQCCEGLR